jgi:hypothetical protein
MPSHSRPPNKGLAHCLWLEGLFETVADLRACPELMRLLLCDMKLYRSHTVRRGHVMVRTLYFFR